MTETTVLGGSVDNGRTGDAVFPFYSGPVGIRDRGGRLEVAFFAQGAKPQLPLEGLLDGVTVTIVEITQSGLVETPSRKARVAPVQSIVATVIPVASK